MKDMLTSITVKKVTAPISGAADDVAQVGAKIDHQGYESVTYVIATGVLSDADATFTVLLEDSPDNSTFTAVADAYMISQGANAPEVDASFQFDDDGEVRTLGYIGQQRYSRMTITPATNTGAWLIGVICILGHRRVKPFTQPAS